MNQEQLQAIRERVKKATPGPWWDESGIIHAPHPENWSPDNHSCVHVARVDDELGENAEFIAHAREDVPALLDELEIERGYSKNLHEHYEKYRKAWEERGNEIERLRGALEYYGNRDTYETPVDSALGGTTLEILKDHGKRARQALAGEST